MRATDILGESLKSQLYVPRYRQVDEMGQLKPRAKVWTSTAIKTPNGYTSKWLEWVKTEMPQWGNDTGFLFDVSPSAKILQINTDNDAIKIAKEYGVRMKNGFYDLLNKMPWDKIAKDYDAVHHVPINRYDNPFMSYWDVESTAWFNAKMLLNKQQVNLNNT